MQPEFWQERWRICANRLPSIQRRSHSAEPLADTQHSRQRGVFVPLCGKSLDLEWLRDRGHAVSGVEISAIAVEAFFMEQGILATAPCARGVRPL